MMLRMEYDGEGRWWTLIGRFNDQCIHVARNQKEKLPYLTKSFELFQP